MDDKDRLLQIEGRYEHELSYAEYSGVGLILDDYLWLIDYANHLQRELEKSHEVIRHEMVMNGAYIKALEFYADVENYKEYDTRKGLVIDVLEDNGKTADEALNYNPNKGRD